MKSVGGQWEQLLSNGLPVGMGAARRRFLGAGLRGLQEVGGPGEQLLSDGVLPLGMGVRAEEAFGDGPQGVARGCRLGRTVVVEWAAGGDGSGAEEGAG